MMDIEAIRQSPRQFVDLETVEQLSDAVMLLQMEIENLRKELAEVKEIELPKKVQAVADRWKKKVNRLESELADLKASLGEPVAEVIEYHVEGTEYGRNGAEIRDAELLDTTLPVGIKLYAQKGKQE